MLSLLAAMAALLTTEAAAQQAASLCVDFTYAANTDDERYIPMPFTGSYEVTGIMFAPATAVAVNASNVNAFTVAMNAGTASTSWTTLASHTTDSDLTSSAYVIGTVIDLTVTKPATVSRGYQFRVENTNGGTGAAFDGAVCIALRKVG
jgi:hypothetical protein